MISEHDRFYEILARLESGVGGRRLLSECTAASGWPARGLYFFFEPGESRASGAPRVVRVGTHAVGNGRKSTLWSRLRMHRGTRSGLGNHRGSVFRLRVGEALAKRESALLTPTWADGTSAPPETRKLEEPLERAVSAFIGTMSVLWVAIGDEPNKQSDRAYIERNAIGLLSCATAGSDRPSSSWLGSQSASHEIRTSGLWNVDHVNHEFDRGFLSLLETYVDVTLGLCAPPIASLAPAGWCG